MPIIQVPRAREYVQELRRRLEGETVTHCIFTAEYMDSFALQAGITTEQAVTTGLLHDLCKDMDAAALLAAARQYGIAPNPAQLEKPGLLHGPVAAEECRRTLGITDDTVYEAIYWHTTGKPGFGPLGLALYVADFAEPSRRTPHAAKARDLLRTNGFRATVRFVAEKKLEHVRTKHPIDPTTEAFHAWLQTTPD